MLNWFQELSCLYKNYFLKKKIEVSYLKSKFSEKTDRAYRYLDWTFRSFFLKYRAPSILRCFYLFYFLSILYKSGRRVLLINGKNNFVYNTLLYKIASKLNNFFLSGSWAVGTFSNINVQLSRNYFLGFLRKKWVMRLDLNQDQNSLDKFMQTTVDFPSAIVFIGQPVNKTQLRELQSLNIPVIIISEPGGAITNFDFFFLFDTPTPRAYASLVFFLFQIPNIFQRYFFFENIGSKKWNNKKWNNIKQTYFLKHFNKRSLYFQKNYTLDISSSILSSIRRRRARMRFFLIPLLNFFTGSKLKQKSITKNLYTLFLFSSKFLKLNKHFLARWQKVLNFTKFNSNNMLFYKEVIRRPLAEGAAQQRPLKVLFYKLQPFKYKHSRSKLLYRKKGFKTLYIYSLYNTFKASLRLKTIFTSLYRFNFNKQKTYIKFAKNLIDVKKILKFQRFFFFQFWKRFYLLFIIIKNNLQGNSKELRQIYFSNLIKISFLLNKIGFCVFQINNLFYKENLYTHVYYKKKTNTKQYLKLKQFLVKLLFRSNRYFKGRAIAQKFLNIMGLYNQMPFNFTNKMVLLNLFSSRSKFAEPLNFYTNMQFFRYRKKKTFLFNLPNEIIGGSSIKTMFNQKFDVSRYKENNFMEILLRSFLSSNLKKKVRSSLKIFKTKHLVKLYSIKNKPYTLLTYQKNVNKVYFNLVFPLGKIFFALYYKICMAVVLIQGSHFKKSLYYSSYTRVLNNVKLQLQYFFLLIQKEFKQDTIKVERLLKFAFYILFKYKFFYFKIAKAFKDINLKSIAFTDKRLTAAYHRVALRKLAKSALGLMDSTSWNFFYNERISLISWNSELKANWFSNFYNYNMSYKVKFFDKFNFFQNYFFGKNYKKHLFSFKKQLSYLTSEEAGKELFSSPEEQGAYLLTKGQARSAYYKNAFYNMESIPFWKRTRFTRRIIFKIRKEEPFFLEGINRRNNEIGMLSAFTLYDFSNVFLRKPKKKKRKNAKFNLRKNLRFKLSQNKFWDLLKTYNILNFAKKGLLGNSFVSSLQTLMWTKYSGALYRTLDFDLLKYPFIQHYYPLLPFFYNMSSLLVLKGVRTLFSHSTVLNKFSNKPFSIFTKYKLFLTYLNMYYYKKRTHARTTWFFFKKRIPFLYFSGRSKWSLGETFTIRQRRSSEKNRYYSPSYKITKFRRNVVNGVYSYRLKKKNWKKNKFAQRRNKRRIFKKRH